MRSSHFSESSLFYSLPTLSSRSSDPFFATARFPDILIFVLVWLTTLCNLKYATLLCSPSTKSGYSIRRLNHE